MKAKRQSQTSLLQKRERYAEPAHWLPGLEFVMVGVMTTNHRVDADSRPLGELDAHPRIVEEAKRQGVPFVEKMMKKGDRAGKLVNSSAMKQISSCWSEILDTLAWCSQCAREEMGTKDINLAVLWITGTMSVQLHAWRAGAGEKVERVCSALYKAGQGLALTAGSITTGVGNEDAPIPDPLDCEEVIDFVFESGTLSMRPDRACGGPDDMIKQFFRVGFGKTSPPSTSPFEDWDDAKWVNFTRHCRAVTAAQLVRTWLDLRYKVNILALANGDSEVGRNLGEKFEGEMADMRDDLPELIEPIERTEEIIEILAPGTWAAVAKRFPLEFQTEPHADVELALRIDAGIAEQALAAWSFITAPHEVAFSWNRELLGSIGIANYPLATMLEDSSAPEVEKLFWIDNERGQIDSSPPGPPESSE